MSEKVYLAGVGLVTPTAVPGHYEHEMFIDGERLVTTISALGVRSVPDDVEPPETHKSLVRRLLGRA